MPHRAMLVALSLALLVPSRGALAQGEPAPFYQNKQVSLLVGYPPGGGYDAYGRLFARHLGAHLPGNPSVVASNMPGAGSLVLANHLYNRAAKDGLVIGVVAGDMALNPLFGHPEAHYDSLRLSWIGSMSEETHTCFAWHTVPITSIQDVFVRPLIVGTSSATGTTYSYPASSNQLLGTKFKIVSGYDGTNGAMLAVERGELEGMCGTAWGSIRTARPEWLSRGLIRVILQEATRRNHELPDVPTVMDLATTDRQKQILELIYGWQIMGRPVVAPPDVPRDRLAVLRTAFAAVMRDPAFLADAEKTRLDIDPVTAEEIEAFLGRIYRSPKPIVEEAARALGRSKQN